MAVLLAHWPLLACSIVWLDSMSNTPLAASPPHIVHQWCPDSTVVLAVCITVYLQAAIAPELTGISSSPQPHGIIDRINRALFGGRLIYFGPAYFVNILGGPINFFNTTRCWAFNLWTYNRAACKRLYDSTLDLIATVEREMGEGAAQGVAAADRQSTGANGVSNGNGSSDSGFGRSSNSSARSTAGPASVAVGGSSVSFGEVASGGLKQRQQQAGATAAPLGIEDVGMIRSLEAQPARGT